ncbi:phosphatidylserine decarboxylase family protein [Hugenholtzia roseola]|uniref:phosphatidylserine decarboxylase family protein n=1 Tax=Hugenholtzia roseola TaxID=1002 RepID=UPI0004788FC0|nr:phosphatidylserine decarboxylase family protein [Hugenholtzia roseola]
MTIHREGYPSLLITTLALAALIGAAHYFTENVWIHNIAIGIGLFFFLVVLQFFRNPTVVIEKNENQILAPADGKVVVIEEVEEPEYFKGKRKQVSIFMSPINVHVNRNPITGKVKFFKYHPGLYLVAWHPKASTDNERTTVVLQHRSGKELLMRQIAGALARRICWYVKEEQIVEQGQEFGFIKFGSRVDLFLPLDAKIEVDLQQVTKAGKTVIATW